MKKSLYLALTFCILFFAFSFSVNAVKNETFNTVDGEVVSIYSEEYEVTVNIFGRPICMNTQGTLYNIFYGDIDKIDNIKVNFIDIDGNTAETVANFKNSELFEEFTSNNISFCYAPNEYGNNVMWRLLRNFGSDTNSVALPTTVYINSEGEILEFSSGVQGKEDILRVLNCENSFNEKVEFSVKGKANYDYAYEVLNLLNELRSSIGLPTLAMNKELLDVAMQRAAEISVYYSHTRPDGTNCTTAFPVQYGALAENIAMGQISPSEVMYDWTNSPGHFSNMTWNALNSVGIGVFEDADGNMYWVQFFYSGESDHYVKSGVEEKIFQITATLSNLNISCYLQGEKDQIYLEKGDKTNVIISNSESGSDFQVKSENEDLLYIDENGVATVKGETPFDVKLKVFYRDNPDVYFDVTLTIGHEHNYSSYSTGQNYKCGVEKKLYQYVCVLCEHTYEEEITTGNHKFSESDITVEPTCTTAGTTTFTCICGDTYTETIPATNHANATTDAGKEPTTTEVGYTAGKYCPDCDAWIEGHVEIPKLEAHTHNFIETIIRESTCKEKGLKKLVCSCGEEKEEEIEKTEHHRTENRCSSCGAYYIGLNQRINIYDPASGSRFGYIQWGTTDGLNFIDTGIDIDYEASVDYLVYKTYAIIEGTKLGEWELGLIVNGNLVETFIIIVECNHKFGDYISNNDNICKDGTKTAKCEFCDATDTLVDVGSATHNFGEYTYNNDATCNINGTETALCKGCGVSDKREALNSKTNHPNATTDAGKEPTTTEVGYTAGKYCPDCKTWLEGHEEIPMLHTHTYTSTITKEATCWREGVQTYTCSCGESYTEAIAKLDHEYRPWETKKNPTCTAPGLEWSYCLLCDNDFEREIPATGHTIIDYTRRATPDSDGAYVTACDVCNDVFKSISFGRPTEYKLSTTKYTYDGKTKTPKLTVETSDGVVLKEGVDYELELPSGRKVVGVYTYRVVFKGNYLGEKKVSYQILPGKTTSVSATQSTDSIKLTWKKVTGADGYRVYQYNSKTGKYEKIKTLTGTSYTVKKLKAGTTYKFAVKAYSKADGETLWASSYKTITTATKPATPIIKATAGSKQATISWNKVTGATGYVVYMQDEFGDYNKIGSTKNTSYSIKNLGYGETCRFRIVAYKKVDGKNIYGGYKTVKITVPYPAIYVTPSGKRYHYDKECAGKNATKITLANAKKTRTPCKTCVL